ncbi:MAG: hypothetical protein PVG51_10400 [Desulfosarcina sp.]
MITMFGLVAIWTVIRVMEALHGNPVLDMILTNWLGLIVWTLLLLWLTRSVLVSVKSLKETPDNKAAWVAWTLFGVILVTMFVCLEGFRMATSGLLSVLSGSPEDSQQAIFLLAKFHPFNPLLALNLTLLKLTGISWGLESMVPYLWHWNALFAFFLWSCVCGTVLMMRKDNRGAKVFHLSLAVMGIAALIYYKSINRPSAEILIAFQAAFPVLMIFQILLLYASARYLVTESKPSPSKIEAQGHPVPEGDETSTGQTINLPPSAIRIALFVFLVLPILADLQGRFQLSVASARIVAEVSEDQAHATTKRVAVAPVSIRTGPATGDDVIGVLPRGTHITVKDEKFNWVNIGKNRWVPEKFLRPLTPHKTLSSGLQNKG